MLPDRVSNPGPLTYESGVLPIALRGPPHYKLRKIVSRADFSDRFRKVIMGYKRIGYNIYVMRHLHV